MQFTISLKFVPLKTFLKVGKSVVSKKIRKLPTGHSSLKEKADNGWKFCLRLQLFLWTGQQLILWECLSRKCADVLTVIPKNSKIPSQYLCSHLWCCKHLCFVDWLLSRRALFFTPPGWIEKDLHLRQWKRPERFVKCGINLPAFYSFSFYSFLGLLILLRTISCTMMECTTLVSQLYLWQS